MTTMGWQRLKLVALIAIFVMPMALAWGMVEFRIGIPDNRTAHGALDADLPPLSRWPAQQRTDIASRDGDGRSRRTLGPWPTIAAIAAPRTPIAGGACTER